MASGFRLLAYAGAFALILTVASRADADTIAITSGSASAYSDGSLTSFSISSADSQFTSEYFGAALNGFNGGSLVDFSTTIPASNSGNHALPQTYRGQPFQQAWVSGSLTITAKTFVAPHANGDGSTSQSFTTTFTMTGTITAYANADHTGAALFSTDVSGGGTISAGPYRIVGDSYVLTGAEAFRFTAPTPSGLPPPWSSDDVGAVGQPGDAIDENGTFTVSGAGADIWGDSDAFHFVSQPVSANVDIVARVRAEQNTHTFAKAGLMIRGSLAANSWHVILDVRPGGGIEFMTRSATGGTTTFIAGASSPFLPGWLKLSRQRESYVLAYASRDGVSWSSLGTAIVPLGAALVGLAVTSHDTSVTNSATFDNIDVAPLPEGWFHSDIGEVGRASRASEANGVFTVSGAGSDIWGTADSFAYVNTLFGGDGSMQARVVGEQNTHPFAKAGVALGLASADSAGVILDVLPDGSIEFMARFADGQPMSFIAGASVPFPVSLKITRAGEVFTGATSPDGTTWTPVGSVMIQTSQTMYAGLAVTSHDPSVLNTSIFDTVSVTSGAAASSPSSDIVVYASDVPDAALHGSWTKASDATSPQGVKLETPDNALTTTAMASPTDYVDVSFNAAAGTPYTLWLRLQALANSKFNDSVWVQFSDAFANGSSVYPIGSTDALLVNLATDSTATSLSGWGWQNAAYWLSQATTVSFATSGAHTLRIQVREDGVQLDQIVLSPSRFKTSAPGPAGSDSTIVPK